MSAKSYAESLRKLADFYDTNPDVPLPTREMTVWLTSEKNPKTLLRSLGSFDKDYIGTYFDAIKKFDDIKLTFTFQRDQVCERKVVGKKRIDAVFTAEKVIPATMVEAHDEDIVVWDCHPVIAGEPEVVVA